MPYPITAEEVSAMFRKAGAAPWPDDESNLHLATYLSGHMPEGRRQSLGSRADVGWHPSPDRTRCYERWIEAAAVIRSTRYLHCFPNGNTAPGQLSAIADLETALARVEVMLSAKPAREEKNKRWVPPAVALTCTIASILADECGRRGGVSDNSTAVKFVALALSRIGWRSGQGQAITVKAVAGCLATLGVTAKDVLKDTGGPETS